MPLDPITGRVLASLVEKQLTTPQQYPLSLNALTLACNQTSNRDPVTSYEEATVREALDRLKADGLVRFVLPSHGRSVVRYRHALVEKLALDPRQLALTAVLMLRGPQTAAELRARTERMVVFDRLEEVEADLEGLAAWPEPLVTRSGRQPGQKEQRWTHLLFSPDRRAGGPPPEAATGATAVPAGPAGGSADTPAGPDGAPADAPGRPGAPADRPAGPRFPPEAEHDPGIRSEIVALRRELDELRREVDELRRALGG